MSRGTGRRPEAQTHADWRWRQGEKETSRGQNKGTPDRSLWKTHTKGKPLPSLLLASPTLQAPRPTCLAAILEEPTRLPSLSRTSIPSSSSPYRIRTTLQILALAAERGDAESRMRRKMAFHLEGGHCAPPYPSHGALCSNAWAKLGEGVVLLSTCLSAW